MNRNVFIRPLIWLMLGLLATGCGDDRPARVPVSGRVTIDGKPLETGTIMVVPAKDRVATGAIDKDGRFALTTFELGDGCVLGKHAVCVTSYKQLTTTTIMRLVPKKYGNHQQSGLEMQVGGPRSDVLLELKWGNEKPTVERIEANP